ncbi:hypothetical protein TVAG_472610 [Trichomonas vaginalis G3]|uniref:Protein HGH1 N-terminal domain-containing protein n=1 Tax=Trichomonas vaginalis (strain ATCC PRA-98 / G3) TaxID=412133 RepID=A2FU88_TRIV3|nr:protein of unknown function (DUF383) [Trichomonas vaginalis G3]EAX91519.1 hypothetical protein TVAG_472610 [Trichomonas vaginalis G3]KAI5537953.1 protein of unknown function (DUF383) [Trichomonas vaginalis G3]|eukprot:XP_001304449.1 hypothetical protein [Trichomonas vaginalis G3]
MDQVITQLRGYLTSNDERVLVEATKLCQGQNIPAVIPELLKLTSHTNIEVSANALIALIDMTSKYNEAIRQIISFGGVTRLLEASIAAIPSNVNYRLMLLTNITTEHQGTLDLLDLKDPELKGQRLLRLAIRFATPPAEYAIPQTEMLKGLPIKASTTINDEYEYAAMVLMNATLVKEGREIFYENPKFFMPSFLESMSSNNPIRKQGIIGVIRNLCFDNTRHQFLLEEANILKHIIRPLVPPSIEDNITAFEMLQQAFPGVSFPGLEQVTENRRNLLETLMLLTQSEVGKQHLIQHHVVFVMREVQAQEKDERCQELTLRIGAILLGPENLPSKEEAEKLQREIDAQNSGVD